MHRLLIFLLLPCVGCVMPSDIAALRETQIRYESSVSQELKNMRDGTQTVTETAVKLQEHVAKRDAEQAVVVANVQKRTEDAIAIANGIKDGSIGWGEVFAGGGVVGGILGIGQQLLRNRSRRREMGAIVGSIDETDSFTEELEARLAALEKAKSPHGPT